MSYRPACAALLSLVGALTMSAPAVAQQDYLYGEQNFRNACRAPLKYAAGACVRRCPAGYRERGGRYCRPPGPSGWGD